MKILVKKQKKEFVKELNKEVVVSKERIYYVSDISKDFNTNEGVIKKADLKKKDGSIVKTNQDKEFVIFSSSFIDDFQRINRLAQIITPKDIGAIIAFTGLNKSSKVLDAGSGSGALAIFLATIAKNVVTYDINDEYIKLVKENVKKMNIKNITVKKGDIYREIKEKYIDVITLDVPAPWNAIKTVDKVLKIGGFLVSYSPTVLQVSDFVNQISHNPNFLYLKTIELLKRDWKIEGRIARPHTQMLGHTGFLTFVRKIQ